MRCQFFSCAGKKNSDEVALFVKSCTIKRTSVLCEGEEKLCRLY